MPDTESFDGFYRATRQRVIACLYAVSGSLAEAQDLGLYRYHSTER